jgi:hypothetical protein
MYYNKKGYTSRKKEKDSITGRIGYMCRNCPICQILTFTIEPGEELARLKETTRLQRRQYWERQRLANLHTKNDLQNYAILSKREKT